MQFDRMGDISIIFVGTVMHLQRLSPFGACCPRATQLVPNAASTIVAVSLLMALTKWRPIRGPMAAKMNLSQRILRLLVELTTITCMVEFLLVRIWLPMLVGLIGVCDWVTEGWRKLNFLKLADFINKCFYTFRLVLALIVAASITALQRWLTTISK
ncbi:hypothetical protein KR038_007346, partial [Drosophila bunnanda]